MEQEKKYDTPEKIALIVRIELPPKKDEDDYDRGWRNGYRHGIADHAQPLEEALHKVMEALESMCSEKEEQNFGIRSPEQWQTEAYKSARELLTRLK